MGENQTQNGRQKKNEKMVLISVHIPKQMLDELDRLVQEGRYPNRSEAIRVAIRDLLLKEREIRRRTENIDVPIVTGR